MPINVILKGQEDSYEYKAGLQLKELFEKSISNRVSGNILIACNVTLFGQEVKDIDIVVIGSFDLGYSERLKFRPEGEDAYVENNVYLSNFCLTIEVKKHQAKDISIGRLNNVLVNYNGKKHDVTYQSEKQKYSLHRYLKNIDEVGSSVFVNNLIWLRNVSPEELSYLKSEGEHNILPSKFSIKWLLMLVLSQKKPYSTGATGHSYWGFSCYKYTDIEFKSFEIAFELFEKVKQNVGAISRSHFERISKRILKEQKYAEAILDNSSKGGKFVIIQGKAGTGKTVKLLNIACDLCVNYGYRCLILTYNFTLVADIRRTLTLAHIPDGIGKESVRIMTLYKFFIDLFEAFGIYKDDEALDDQTFFKNYPKYCAELAKFINESKKPERPIEEVIEQNHQLLSWDYVLIDEAQDWLSAEVEILYAIFGPGRIVIAQAPDQKIRLSNDPKWVKPFWRPNREFVQTHERKSLRQKKNLVNFVNQFASKFNLTWELQASTEFEGGQVIITDKYELDFHREIYQDCLNDGNKAYEMLFLVPPSLVVNDGEKPVTFNRNGIEVTKKLKLRHCSLVDKFGTDIDFWDGTNKDLRKDYPIKIDQHRLIQYDSCRGLEGWSVVCIELDELVRYLDKKYEENDLEEPNELAFESPEEKKLRYIYSWTLIPLTRAIDTLVITIKNKDSYLAKRLYEIYKENTFIEWR